MTDLLPAFMFLVFTLLVLVGYPIAFTIGGSAMAFGLYTFGIGFFDLLPLRVWGIMTNFTLIAVPLFIFMGVTLERSGLAVDLLESMELVSGRFAGGPALSVVLVGTLLAASTGIVGATVTTMGVISLPAMLHRGYQKELAVGVVCASGTPGQSIPPSIVLILVGDILGIPVGDLFLGALIPGVDLAGLYLLYLLAVSVSRPYLMPAISPNKRRGLSHRELWAKTGKALIPPLAL
ncbi:MAG: TRAP transporter large permease subunit [Candidatus Binatia bacterium]|nr:TRAP transporter large permease subunit [Candidatus Binatia bacterium]